MVLSLCIDTIKGTFCSLGFRSEVLRWTGPRENAQTQASVDTEG